MISPPQGYYYTAIIEDLFLRFGWVLSMSLTEMGYAHGDLMITILSPLEVFRSVSLTFDLTNHLLYRL